MNKQHKRVFDFFGSQAKTSRSVGISKQAVGKWAKGGRISIDNAKKIQILTNGLITKEQLRPDVFD